MALAGIVGTTRALIAVAGATINSTECSKDSKAECPDTTTGNPTLAATETTTEALAAAMTETDRLVPTTEEDGTEIATTRVITPETETKAVTEIETRAQRAIPVAGNETMTGTVESDVMRIETVTRRNIKDTAIPPND